MISFHHFLRTRGYSRRLWILILFLQNYFFVLLILLLLICMMRLFIERLFWWSWIFCQLITLSFRFIIRLWIISSGTSYTRSYCSWLLFKHHSLFYGFLCVHSIGRCAFVYRYLWFWPLRLHQKSVLLL